MSNVNDPEMLGIIPCSGCFRRSDKAHCPKCGSYDNRVMWSKILTAPHPHTGVMTKIQSYKCKRCGLSFTDFDWQFNCNAPEYFPRHNTRHQTVKSKGKFTKFSSPIGDPIMTAHLERLARKQIEDMAKKAKQQEELDNGIMQIKEKK